MCTQTPVVQNHSSTRYRNRYCTSQNVAAWCKLSNSFILSHEDNQPFNDLDVRVSNNRAHEVVVGTGGLLRLGLSPRRITLGKLENAGQRQPGEKEKEWTDCVAEAHRVFGITGDWSTAALDPGTL